MEKIVYCSVFRCSEVMTYICCFIFSIGVACATSDIPFQIITKDGVYSHNQQTVRVESSPLENGDMHEYVVVVTFGSGASDSDKTLRFTTTYGKYEIYLIDLNGDSFLDVIIRKGVGSGPRARSEFFCFHIQQYDRFWEQFQFPASGYFTRTATGGHWKYAMKFGEKVDNKTPVTLFSVKGSKEAPPITLVFGPSGFKTHAEAYIGD